LYEKYNPVLKTIDRKILRKITNFAKRIFLDCAGREQWSSSPLFTLQNSGDDGANEEERGGGETDRAVHRGGAAGSRLLDGGSAPSLLCVFFLGISSSCSFCSLPPPLSVSVFCPFFFDSLLSLLLCFHLQDLAVAVVVLVALGQTVVLLFLRFPCPLFLPSLLFFLLFSVLLMFLFSLCLLCSFSFFLPPSVLSTVSPLSVLCPPPPPVFLKSLLLPLKLSLCFSFLVSFSL